jgi:hypothetical protein
MHHSVEPLQLGRGVDVTRDRLPRGAKFAIGTAVRDAVKCRDPVVQGGRARRVHHREKGVVMRRPPTVFDSTNIDQFN